MRVTSFMSKIAAGVDASFERMFRQMAPMDSIVQAMGRAISPMSCFLP